MTSFSEQIAQLTIPDPHIDPEDDINEGGFFLLIFNLLVLISVAFTVHLSKLH